MRTLLTYVLAATAAACVGTLAQGVTTGAFLQIIARGNEVGDLGVVAGGVADQVALALVWFVILMLIGSLAWFLTFRVVGDTTHRLGLPGYAILGAGLVFALVMGCLLLITGPTLFEFGIGFGTETGNSVLTQMLTGFGLAWVVAGAAWGTVFWIRAPKPEAAGIAA